MKSVESIKFPEKRVWILSLSKKLLGINRILKKRFWKYIFFYKSLTNNLFFFSHNYPRFNRLVVRVLSTLKDCGKAIDGLLVMSNELELVYNGILDNKVIF